MAAGGLLAWGVALLDGRPSAERAELPVEPSAPAESSSSKPAEPNRAAAATTQFKRVEGERYAFSVPLSWRPIELPIKTVAIAYRAPTPEPHHAEEVVPGVKLVVEPWDQSLSEYVDLGLDNLQDVGKAHHQQVTRAGAYPAIEVELSLHKVSKPYRSLKRVAVVDGLGYVFSCDGPLDDFDAIRATCQRITASLRIHPQQRRPIP